MESKQQQSKTRGFLDLVGLQGDGVTQCRLYYCTIQRGSTRGNLRFSGLLGGWHDAMRCALVPVHRDGLYRTTAGAGAEHIQDSLDTTFALYALQPDGLYRTAKETAQSTFLHTKFALCALQPDGLYRTADETGGQSTFSHARFMLCYACSIVDEDRHPDRMPPSLVS